MQCGIGEEVRQDRSFYKSLLISLRDVMKMMDNNVLHDVVEYVEWSEHRVPVSGIRYSSSPHFFIQRGIKSNISGGIVVPCVGANLIIINKRHAIGKSIIMPQSSSSSAPISAGTENVSQESVGSITGASPPKPMSAPQPVFTNVEEAARKCSKWVESGITKNKSIQFLLKTLIDSGCTPPERFIRCVQCEQPQAGGFGMLVEESLDTTTATSPDVASAMQTVASKEQCHRTAQEIREQMMREQSGSSKLKLQPEIYVCQQYMDNEHMAHKVVHHELIHAIDMCRTKMDPLHNCIHLACTEIRAENLSGECSFFKEIPRMASYRKHGQECVRRRAILSVKANPTCSARAEEYVDAALPRCFQDHYPYDRHPNQR